MQCLRFGGQIAMSNPGISKIEFAADSPLEGNGLELSSREWATVLRSNPTKLIEAAEIAHPHKRGRRFESISLQR
jgi:hypothetical protein